MGQHRIYIGSFQVDHYTINVYIKLFILGFFGILKFRATFIIVLKKFWSTDIYDTYDQLSVIAAKLSTIEISHLLTVCVQENKTEIKEILCLRFIVLDTYVIEFRYQFYEKSNKISKLYLRYFQEKLKRFERVL